MLTLIQRFGSALNLNIHFHVLFLDGVYAEYPDGSLRFRWVTAPTSAELTHLIQVLAHRIGRLDARRTVGSWLAQAHLIERVLNHSTQATTAIYARFAQDHVREALEAHGKRVMGIAGKRQPADVEPLAPSAKRNRAGLR